MTSLMAPYRSAWLALFCGCVSASCVPGDSVAFVRITDPQPGQTVTGAVKFHFDSARPFAFRGYSLAFDDAPPSPLKDTADDGALLTTELPNGSRRLRVFMRAWGGRSWQDDVTFIVDNPPQRVVRLENANLPRPGDSYRARVILNLPDVTVRATGLDVPGMLVGDVRITPVDASSVDLELAIPKTVTYSLYRLTLSLALGERALAHELTIRIDQGSPLDPRP